MDDEGGGLDKWRAQMRKGFLELCVLAAIRARGQSYGLDLMESLSDSGLALGEGTVYPLLTRLVREGLLEARWETPERGHPRKYYRLTDRGGDSLEAMRREYEAGYAVYRGLAAVPEDRAAEGSKEDEDAS